MSEYFTQVIENTEDIYDSLPISLLSFACEYCEDEVGEHICVPILLDLIENDSEFAYMLEEVLNAYGQ